MRILRILFIMIACWPATVSAYAQPKPSDPCPVYELPGFIVNFHPGATTLDTNGLAVANAFADYFKSSQASANPCLGPITKVVLTGYADSLDVETMNPALSQNRAETVAAKLVELGVPQNKIKVLWRNSVEPAKHAAHGGRDHVNRKVTIDYYF